MDNHFTITINDDKGVKQFNVHKFIKKAIFYGALFLVVFALLSLGTIFYLYSTVNDLNTTQKELKVKNKELSKNIELTQDSLDKKKRRIR